MIQTLLGPDLKTCLGRCCCSAPAHMALTGLHVTFKRCLITTAVDVQPVPVTDNSARVPETQWHPAVLDELIML